MNSVSFDISVVDQSGGPAGQIIITYNNGSQNIPLTLSGIYGVAQTGFFTLVPYDGSIFDLDINQAENFVFALNRDFRNIGGTNNLNATNSGSTVTITAQTGTFPDSQSGYLGFALSLTNFVYNNPNPNVDPIVLSVAPSSPASGSCTSIQYFITATGGTPPFRISNGLTVLDTNWSGTSLFANFDRETNINIQLRDPGTLELLKEFSTFTPRAIAAGDFEIINTNFENGSGNVEVIRTITIADTDPLEYAIESDLQAVSGTNYQTSNIFSGIAQGQYKVFIKDVYGCEVSKQITVTGNADATATEVIRFFQIMEGQGIIFYPNTTFGPTQKKNYFNTGSRNEFVLDGARYNMFHPVNVKDNFLEIQFKSSYDFHIITLFKCDGTKTDLPFLEIQQNLGVEEEYDCVIYPFSANQTGVYFNGGNQYEPNTDTVIDPSPYNRITPGWDNLGQLVFLNGTALRIVGGGFDSGRGGYFLVDLVTSTEGPARVRTTWNKQDYNVFEALVPISAIDSKAFIAVEKGFSNNGLVEGDVYISEMIHVTEDNDDMLYIEWSDTNNKADIIFQSGISYFMRIRGELVMDPISQSDAYAGDGNTYATELIARTDFIVTIEELTSHQINQLNIAAATRNFRVNDLNLVVKNEEPKIERLGNSNLYSYERRFGFGGNQVAIQQDEIVYSPTTGVVGGGSTGKQTTPDLNNITIYKDLQGRIVKQANGNLIRQ